MDFLKQGLDFFLHLDDHIADFVVQYGNFTYAILFAIVFVETGLVIMPFLPGDSLLFAAGATAAITELNFFFLWLGLIFAAFCGDNVNYFVGKYFGNKIIEWDNKWIKKEYIFETQAFYTKYGVITIILARFMPFVRTFAPFVAGVARMPYPKYISVSLLAAIIWVTLFLSVGYWFGNIEFVKNNFAFVSLGIIAVSLLPIIYKFISSKMSSK